MNYDLGFLQAMTNVFWFLERVTCESSCIETLGSDSCKTPCWQGVGRVTAVACINKIIGHLERAWGEVWYNLLASRRTSGGFLKG